MNMAVAALEYPLVTYTIFDTIWPKEKRERADVPWSELIGRVRNSPTYIDKKHCPLISMAEYGALMSGGENPILRHAANVTRVYGCELDYDLEKMPIEEAASIFMDANICALLYTSPSHKADRPRWRALLPFSEPYSPEKRQEFVARANRLLGGVASRESFTLSQSFYIGRVTGAEYTVIDVPGSTIDYASHLEPLYWVDKHSDGSSTYNKRTDADLRACFNSDSGGRYEAMLSLSSRWAARGMSRDDIEENLHALLALGNTTHNKDGIDLSTRVSPMARSAVSKFGETRAARLPEPAPLDNYEPAGLEISEPGSVEESVGPESNEIQARVFTWRNPKTIPPRQWLYGKHYMRGMVSATAGVGGAGKSTLLLVEAISMAMGRDLLRDGAEIPVGPITVWVHNGEDPYEELERRIGAIMLHYQVAPEEIGDRLRLTSGRDMPIMVAQGMSGGGKLLVPTAAIGKVVEPIKLHKIQAFIADPFVTLHRVNENDNGLIDGVMTLLRDAANESGCAIEIAHHFRKLNGDEPSVDSMRGASSIVGAARSARIVAGMTKEEATKYGIEDDQRGFYSWLQNGKANMLPPTHKRSWLKMESVCLENEAEPYEADNIGVVTSWIPPEAETALNGTEYGLLRRAITNANPLTELRDNIRSTGWIGTLMAKVLERDATDKVVKMQMQSLIGRLLANGSLIQQDAKDPAHSRVVKVIVWNQAGQAE